MYVLLHPHCWTSHCLHPPNAAHWPPNDSSHRITPPVLMTPDPSTALPRLASYEQHSHVASRMSCPVLPHLILSIRLSTCLMALFVIFVLVSISITSEPPTMTPSASNCGRGNKWYICYLSLPLTSSCQSVRQNSSAAIRVPPRPCPLWLVLSSIPSLAHYLHITFVPSVASNSLRHMRFASGWAFSISERPFSAALLSKPPIMDLLQPRRLSS